MELILTDQSQLPGAAKRFIDKLGDHRKAAFFGEIGAGKTTFIQQVCTQLGIREEVTSPSFSLVNEYPLPSRIGQAKIIRHIDLYRLEQVEEAWDIGMEEYLYDNEFCFIEWPEIIESWLPEGCLKLVFEVLPNSGRKIIFL